MRADLANGKAPDWIDYRASVARAMRRADAGESVRTCAGCRTELDVDEARHSPRCTGEETAPPATAQDAEPPAAAEAVDRPRGRGVARWNRGSVEKAILLWATEHGRPPVQRDAVGDPSLPSQSSVRETHGSWANAVEACGFPRPTRGGGPGRARKSAPAPAPTREPEPTPPATDLAEASVPAETVPNAAADVGGWRDRLLAEADRLEQIAAGHRQTVEAIDKTIEQALARVESPGGEAAA